MDMARECAVVSIGRSALDHRSRWTRVADLNLLTYPETVSVARLITSPTFNTQMLQTGLRPSDRHALSLRITAQLFSEDEDNESWRAAHRITTMFNSIAREIEKRPSKPLSPAGATKALSLAWQLRNQ